MFLTSELRNNILREYLTPFYFFYKKSKKYLEIKKIYTIFVPVINN